MVKKIIVIYLLALSFLNAAEFTLKLNRDKALLNEAILATFTLKYKKDELIKIDLQEPNFSGFFVKKLDTSTTKRNNYIYKNYNYLLFANKIGSLVITPQIIKVATREPKTNFVIWKTLLTSTKNITISPSPSLIVGEFKLDLNISSSIIKTNRPLYVTIKLDGIGNVDTIEPFALNLKNAILFSDKPVVKYTLQNGTIKAMYTQKIAILANSDFTIEPISFSYFNPKIKMKENLVSKQFNIKVDKPINYIKYLYILLGFIFGIFVVIAAKFIKKTSKEPSDIAQKIKKAKTDKELYNILLPYANNSKLKIYIKKLEDNIYKNKREKIDKKALLKEL